MQDKMKYKYFISITEGTIFVLLIIFSLLTIFDLFSVELYNYSEIFNLWSLRITIILFILFVSLPFLLIYFKKIGNKAMVKLNNQQLKKKFFEEIKKTREINILNLAQKFDVNLLYVKNYLRDKLSQGMLKGELKGDIFYIKEGFKVMDTKEKRFEFMKENIGKFIAPHHLIKIKEISNNFKVPKNVVTIYIKNLINEGILRGYLEGDTFIRDLSLPDVSSEEIECPHCKKKISLKEVIGSFQ